MLVHYAQAFLHFISLKVLKNLGTYDASRRTLYTSNNLFLFFIFRVKKESQDYMELQEQREKWYEYRLTIYLFHIDHNAPCLRPPFPPPSLKFAYPLSSISFGTTVIRRRNLGLDTLCRRNFGHNGIVGASSIMPA